MSNYGPKEYRSWVKDGKREPASTRFYRKHLKKKKQKMQELPNVQGNNRCEEDPTQQVFQGSGTQQSTASSSVQGQAPGHYIEQASDAAVIRTLRDMASDGSTDDQVGPKEQPQCNVKRRKLRPKTICRVTEDSDDALSSSSEAESSIESHDSASQCKSPVLSPVPSPVESPVTLRDLPSDNNESCNDDMIIDEQENPSAPRRFPCEPLCPCTDTTVQELMFMVLTLGLRHGLTWVAQVDILKMLSTIFKNAAIPTTKHLFKEKLNVTHEEDIQHHVFCCRCQKYLGVKENKMTSKYCATCKRNIKVSTSSNCFVSLSIESQLQKFLKDDYFVNSVTSYRFECSSIPGVFSEIYDGEVYKRFSADGGILSSPYNFSFTFFTDGVAYGKSSNKTIWPIYLTVNELPYHERFKYFVLAGVYAGPKDPNELYFLTPFVDALNILSSHGVDWVHNGKMVTSIVIPLCCVVDSVARYQILNYQSFAGTFGCTFCYKETVYIQKTGSRYPVDVETPQPRTANTYKDDLQGLLWKTNLVDKAYRGVKGACNLYNLKRFSIFDCLVVDYMHCVLGVVKRHTELIIESTRRNMWIGADEDNRILTIMALIDQKLASLQSSTAVIRELRGISHHALWRASEWRLWALFYFIPCLKGLLKDKFIVHFALLSKAVNLLLKRSVTNDDVQLAHKLLLCYIFYFERYFGVSNMVYNLHLLTLISKCVQNFGPIWGQSSFPYESENRYLVQLCKSPYCVPLQVARKFIIYQSLPDLTRTLECSDRIVTFSESILNYKKLVKCHRSSNNECILLGKSASLDVPSNIQLKMGTHASKCSLYQRMIYNRSRYSTRTYCANTANNDSFIFLCNGECAVIDKIIKVAEKVLLGVQIVHVDKAPLLADTLLKYDCVSKILGFTKCVFVSLAQIDEPCLFINVQGAEYVARIPYGCTVE